MDTTERTSSKGLLIIAAAITALLALIAVLMIRDYRESLTPCEDLNWHYMAPAAERACRMKVLGLMANGYPHSVAQSKAAFGEDEAPLPEIIID